MHRRDAPLVEITDLVRPAVVDGVRPAVHVAQVQERLRAGGQTSAARIVGRLPARDGVLDADAVDALTVRVHCEIQRLSEELQQPRRVAEVLRSWVDALRGQTGPGPVRVVDVGCGIGFTLRWLAEHDALGDGVELVGADLDQTLVEHAAALAHRERLRVRFVAGDAFAPDGVVDDPDRTVVISSGLLHHLLDEAELERFFAAQADLGVAGFVHWDPAPGPWSVLGAQMFHLARMREAVSRHDGVVSVRRAHSSATLLRAARTGAAGYGVACRTDRPRRPTLVDVLRPVTGWRRDLGRGPGAPGERS